MITNDKMIEFPGKAASADEIRAKRKKRRLTRAYLVAAVFFAVAAVVIGYFIYVKTKTYDNCVTTGSIKREYLAGTKLLNFDDTILTYSKDGANAIDSTGKLLWNITFDMQSPLVAVSRGTVAFADYGGSRIYVQTSKGDSGVVTTDKPIRKITVSEKGYVGAVLEDTDVTWIYMYDLNGTIISYFRTTMEKSGYPIDIALSPSGELMCVSYYYMDCNDVKSSVAFFNFGEVGQNSIDNYESGFNYTDIMVPYVNFMDNETAFAVSSKRLSMFGGAHKPVSISEMIITDEVLSVFSSSEVIAIVYDNAANNTKYRLELYDRTGKKLSEKAFDFDYSNVCFGKGSVALYGDASLFVCTDSGELKFEGTYSKPILLAVPSSGNYRYTFVTEDSVDTVELQ